MAIGKHERINHAPFLIDVLSINSTAPKFELLILQMAPWTSG